MAFDKNKANIKVDKLLTGLVVKYRVNTYVGSGLFPDFTVRKESDKYKIFLPKGYFKGAPIKADGARTHEASPSYSEGTYACYERAIKEIVTDRAMANADTPVRPKIDTTNFLMEKIALSEEIDKFDLAITTLKAGGSTAYLELTTGGSGTNWRGTGADPRSNFSTARTKIKRNIGRLPNVCFMNTESYEALVQISDVADMIKHTSDRLLTAALPITTVRGIPLSMADALYNSAAQEATASYKNILVDPSAASNKHVMCIFAYVAGGGDPVNFGVNFVARSQMVQRWRGSEGEDREGDFIKVSKIYVPKITSVGGGFILGQVLGTADE